MPNADVVAVVQPTVGVKEPPMYKVIYLNDEKTPMEFVIETLLQFFDYDPDTAFNITMDVHNNGSATVAVLPYEVAEQKGIEVTVCARENKYPLQVKLEPEA